MSDFIHPGFKDEAANDAKRIKAIVNLIGVGADLERFRDLVPQGSDLEDVVDETTVKSSDFIELAARVKRDFEKQARAAESEAAAKNDRKLKLVAACEGIDLESPCDPMELAGSHEAAIQARAKLLASDEAAAAAIASAVAASQRLAQLTAERTVPTVDVAEKAVGLAVNSLEDSRKITHERKLVVEKIRVQLAEAEDALKKAIAAETRASEIVEAAETQLAQAKDYKNLLEELHVSSRTDVKRIPAETIAEANKRCEETRVAVEQGALVRQAKERHTEAEEISAEVRKAENRASQWRDAAAGVEEVLSDVVAELAPSGIKVKIEEGKARLYCDYPGRGQIPFCELSEGEICKSAMDIAIPAVPEGGFLIVDQEPWQGLQPANRRYVADRCREAGVYLLTALVTDDDTMHVEYVE